ncbi:hypothetical protein ACFS07_36320 [Undibacterium arcticum]
MISPNEDSRSKKIGYPNKLWFTAFSDFFRGVFWSWHRSHKLNWVMTQVRPGAFGIPAFQPMIVVAGWHDDKRAFLGSGLMESPHQWVIFGIDRDLGE